MVLAAVTLTLMAVAVHNIHALLLPIEKSRTQRAVGCCIQDNNKNHLHSHQKISFGSVDDCLLIGGRRSVGYIGCSSNQNEHESTISKISVSASQQLGRIEQQQQQQQQQSLLGDRFQDAFDRWRFLQRILDMDDDYDDVDNDISDDEDDDEQLNMLLTIQRLLFQVFHGFVLRMKLPQTSENDDGNDTNESGRGSKSKLILLLEPKLESVQHLGYIPIFCDFVRDTSICNLSLSPNDNSSWSEWLEELLPNPMDDSDAYNGLWDVVIELHGREAVKFQQQQQQPQSSWKLRCLIVRVLIHFDFLSEGIFLS